MKLHSIITLTIMSVANALITGDWDYDQELAEFVALSSREKTTDSEILLSAVANEAHDGYSRALREATSVDKQDLDGGLTASKIRDLASDFNNVLKRAKKRLEALQHSS